MMSSNNTVTNKKTSSVQKKTAGDKKQAAGEEKKVVSRVESSEPAASMNPIKTRRVWPD